MTAETFNPCVSLTAAADDISRFQVAIQHRIGRLELGEASVVIAVGSPHRAEAFEACRWCIDTLKETVPIWKREVCPDGAFWIEGEDALSVQGRSAGAVYALREGSQTRTRDLPSGPR